MKKVLFGLIAAFMLSNISFGQTLTESAIIKLGGRIAIKNNLKKESARTFTILNFNLNYKPLTSYTINGDGYTDDGKFNDVKAGDGIYTSVKSYSEPKTPFTDFPCFIGDDFKYNENLSTSKLSIKIGCKMRHVRTGTTVFGQDCGTVWGGCIEFYDCTVSIDLSF